MRVTAAPDHPAGPAVRDGHVVLRSPGDAVRARRAGRRVVEASGRSGRARGCGSRPRPGWRPATVAWPSCARSPTTTWCRSPPESTTPLLPRWALGRGGLDGADLAGAAAAGRTGPGARRRRRRRPVGDRRRAGAGRRPGGRRLPLASRRPSGPGLPGRRWWCRIARRRRPRWPRPLREAAAGPVDVVLDPVFGAAAAAALRVLGRGGRLVNLGGSAGDDRDLLLGRPAQPLAAACSATPTTRCPSRSGREAITAVAALRSAQAEAGWRTSPSRLIWLRDAWVATQTGRAAPRPVAGALVGQEPGL